MEKTTGKTNSSSDADTDIKVSTLSYKQYLSLKKHVAFAEDRHPSNIFNLVIFLGLVAKLKIPDGADDDTILASAYSLMRRGYRIEELTRKEYDQLKVLYERASYAEPTDMELHEEGAHRNLYNFITKTLALDVEAGRGPVYRRANKLLNFNGPKYENESNELKNGSLVQYGELPGMWRVGVIVGRFNHELHGDVYCVRTPYNAIAGQQYDPIKVGQVRPATSNDLKRCIELTHSDIDHKLSHYLEMVAVANKLMNSAE